LHGASKTPASCEIADVLRIDGLRCAGGKWKTSQFTESIFIFPGQFSEFNLSQKAGKCVAVMRGFLVKIPNKLVKHLFIISPHKVPVTICNTLKKI
jgi:hypothetical protein